nr:peptidase S41 [Cytophagales bacterium]
MKLSENILRATLIGFCLGTVSCESWLLPPDPSVRPTMIFDQLWEDIHQRYAFFEQKGVDWMAVRDKYLPKVNDTLEDQELFALLGDMLYELKDGHVHLQGSYGKSKPWEWYQDHPGDYNEKNIHTNYLRRDHWVSGPLRHQVIDSVLYINYRSFARDLTEANLDIIVERAMGLKGIVLDIRNNSGGNLKNALKIASCFVQRETIFAFQRVKNGPGPTDFGTWTPMTLRSRKKDPYLGQVVVLTNRKSYSASTFFAQMMRVLPNATLLGERTGGGGGTPAYGELSNGWLYRFSATQTIDLEGKQLENGVSPTFRIKLLRSDEIAGRDSIIDEAIRLLSGNSNLAAPSNSWNKRQVLPR